MKKIYAFLLVLLILSSVSAFATTELVPGGHTFGVKVFTTGVIIVGVASIEESSPAAMAGLKTGDIITKIDQETIENTVELNETIQASNGKVLKIEIQRNGKNMMVNLTPANSGENWKIGALVRDSMAGIGTFTFYDPQTGMFGALGHGINDVGTGKLLEISSGTVVGSTVKEVIIGKPGVPGELKGDFNSGNVGGNLISNTETGIYGFIKDQAILGTEQNKPLPIAKNDEVKEGKATILSNIQDDKIEEFEIEITRIYNTENKPKSFMVKVTDAKLLAVTGGIVQGMSGSPILQDGKIIGAVTHVLVNDPERGYGIFIETMLEQAKKSAALGDAA